jgi:hypothetical protein
MAKEGFYMIYVEDGNTPTHKHLDLYSAEREAKRLAEKTGREVYILATHTKIKLAKFIETRCEPPEPLPF